MAKITDVPLKYGFPLFCKPNPTKYLLKNDSVRVADIWSLWHYLIKKNPKCNKNHEKNFMLSLLEQAKYFYETAKSAPIKSQPLLYYYSFLNMAKIVINMDGYKGDTAIYNHGINTKVVSTTNIDNADVTVKLLCSKSGIYSVAYELMQKMNCPPLSKATTFKIKDLLKECVGVHRTYSEIYNESEYYYHVKNVKLLREGKQLLFEGEISKISDKAVTSLISKGYDIVKEDEKYLWRESLDMNSYNVTHKVYYELSKKITQKGLWSYTDGKEYRLYISDEKIILSSESIIYFLMFFLGSITRYNPDVFDTLLTEQDLWMIAEFLKTQPSQFLYAVTSKSIGHTVLIPRTVGLLFLKN